MDLCKAVPNSPKGVHGAAKKARQTAGKKGRKWLSDQVPAKGTQSLEIVSALNSKGAALERFLARRRRK